MSISPISGSPWLWLCSACESDDSELSGEEQFLQPGRNPSPTAHESEGWDKEKKPFNFQQS